MITLTTVGYGDMYPITPAGKFVGSLAAISGIILLAMPVGLLANNFSEQYKSDRKVVRILKIFLGKKISEKEKRKQLRQKRRGTLASNYSEATSCHSNAETDYKTL